MQLPYRPKRINLFFPALLWLGISAVVFAEGSATPAETVDAPKPVFEEWDIVTLDGKTCGYASEITTKVDAATGPQFKTVSEEQFVVKRMGIALKIGDTSTVIEDADGGVISFTQITSGMGSNIESNGLRDGEMLVVTSRGQTQRYSSPRLSALGPEAIRRLSDAVPLQAGQTYSFHTFTPDYPQAPVVETGTVEGSQSHEIRGTTRTLWKLTGETSMMPGVKAVTWVDDQSNKVETVMPIPGIGELHQYTADRAACMKQPEGAEIFATSLIRPQRPISNPGQQAQAVYRLTIADISRKLVLWDQGEQRVLSSEPGTSEIEVAVPRFDARDVSWELPHADTPDLHQYLQPTAYLEVQSPEIIALAKEAVGDEKNPLRAAHLIEQFVRGYITQKDLKIGFASAEETAKSREGDCTEHAVLCAAIGRAAGLPTRCVFGLGYLPPGVNDETITEAVDATTGIFGFHMWAEAWIGPDQWVPMDAALGSFDVGHIAISKTALEDINPLVSLSGPILQLMQNLKIEVVKTISKADYVPPTPPVASAPISSVAPAYPATSASPPEAVAPLPPGPSAPPSTSTMPPGVD